MIPGMDVRPTDRFSDRVAEYVRWRPSYPVEVVRTLERALDIAPGRTRVVDLGAGTGISSALFLAEGYEVLAIEPNAEMRAAAEASLGIDARFRSLAGRAEATGLGTDAGDLAIAAQAFHWFDPPRVRAELLRILRPPGAVALLWNDRQLDSSPFLRGYEELMRGLDDYVAVNHRNVSDEDIAAFFGSPPTTRVFPSHQDFDWEGLLGRALSSSYVPKPAHAGHDGFVAALRALFESEARDGRVRFAYDTRLIFGALARAG
jgi:SAM-dependent methyltransferase